MHGLTTAVLISLVVLLQVDKTVSKRYSFCNFYKTLLWSGEWTRRESAILTCIAYLESGLDTAKVSLKANSLGKRDYGIFQINSYYWCGPIIRPCGPCQGLLDSNIQNDIKCAKMVYKGRLSFDKQKDGFNAWDSYRGSGRCRQRESFDLINGFYWCGEMRPCGSCTGMRDSRIHNDIRCAWRMYLNRLKFNEYNDGFNAWDSYGRHRKCRVEESLHLVKSCKCADEARVKQFRNTH